jgi:tRNA(adenine34) deaminase
MRDTASVFHVILGFGGERNGGGAMQHLIKHEIERTPEYYMRRTLELAESALEQGEFPIAALVVLDGEIISRATTAERREQRFLIHAELLALEEADKLRLSLERRREARLFTNLEPCLMCLGAAMSFFIGGIYYALESPSDGAVAVVKSWKRNTEGFPEYRLPNIKGGLLRQESIRLFQKYVSMNSPGPMWEWAKSLADLG